MMKSLAYTCRIKEPNSIKLARLTCRRNASGIVNVLEIQQNVLTTCLGMPVTIQSIGLPTYCVAVIIKLHVSSKTVVKELCKRKTALSVCTSCHLR